MQPSFLEECLYIHAMVHRSVSVENARWKISHVGKTHSHIEKVSCVGNHTSGEVFTHRERFTHWEMRVGASSHVGKMNVGRGVYQSENILYRGKMNIRRGVHASGSMCTTDSVLLGHHSKTDTHEEQLHYPCGACAEG